ncbi:carbohydrate ABC transporter permease [Natrialba asiatica]|uniref:Sugar ABC transporter permease n=1 Tax=Natrialba asiatica (strain ATCC 700177 / DSM 12278 / JCM 9576 / FERM P-10747 / NBRC 102637 / 172P1) TaxID=29540 RepID=M0B6X0_NATA1|nr:sugar ABC transporter permease [Natrialba asiatica]ELZ05399.1 sugar ABC transporter permease [Natrialba asiatica DSM 12278]
MTRTSSRVRSSVAEIEIGRYLPLYNRLSDEQQYAYKLLLPGLAMMLLIHFIPIVWGVLISVLGVDSGYVSQWYEAPFVWAENYRFVLDPRTVVGERFWYSLRQTVIFSVGTLLLTYVLGLTAALLLNQRFKGRFAARTLLLLPWVAPSVVTLLIWRMMFQQQSGIINSLLLSLGVISEPIYWLIGDNTIWTLILVHSWTQFPLVMIMLYAGLQSIPEQLYEAASIDGAGRWEQFRYITFPQLKPVSAVVVLLMMLWTMINFTSPYILLGAQPPQSGQVSILYIYNFAFSNYQFGRGAAMSVVLFAIAMAMAMLYYKYLFDQDFTEGDR